MDLADNHRWTMACPKERHLRHHESPDGMVLPMYKQCWQKTGCESDQVFISNYHFIGNSGVRESCYHHGNAIRKIQDLEN